MKRKAFISILTAGLVATPAVIKASTRKAVNVPVTGFKPIQCAFTAEILNKLDRNIDSQFEKADWRNQLIANGWKETDGGYDN